MDYVVPSDFMHTGTNMKTEDFVTLAEGTACKILPAIHNRIGMDEPNEHYRLMALENLRAAAQNYYRFGADGVSPYNFQYAIERRAVAHRTSAYSDIMWPAALGWLRELRYPDQIAAHDRPYLFYAVWRKSRRNITGTPNDDNIYLDRAQPTPAGSRRFRMAEKFDDPGLRTTVQFKAIGLTEQDKLKIQINGHAVPREYVRAGRGINVVGDTFYLHYSLVTTAACKSTTSLTLAKSRAWRRSNSASLCGARNCFLTGSSREFSTDEHHTT